MRRITWILALGLAALALGAAGCGGDDDEGSGDGTGSSATETPAAPKPHRGDRSGGGETLTVTADPGGAHLMGSHRRSSAKAGSVTLKLVNESSTPHAIEIEGNGVEEETETITGGEAEVTVDLQGRRIRVLLPGREPHGRR